MMKTIPRLEAIDHVHVYAKERDSAEKWYERALGIKRATELEHWATVDGPLFLKNDEGTVSLALFQGTRQGRPTTIAFRAAGAEFLAWRSYLVDVAVAFQLEDHDLSYSLYFADPEGNPFEITSYDHAWLKKQAGRLIGELLNWIEGLLDVVIHAELVGMRAEAELIILLLFHFEPVHDEVGIKDVALEEEAVILLQGRNSAS